MSRQWSNTSLDAGCFARLFLSPQRQDKLLADLARANITITMKSYV
jgi:hypothetical protein